MSKLIKKILSPDDSATSNTKKLFKKIDQYTTEDEIKKLLDKKINVTVRNDLGETILIAMCRSEYNNLSIMKQLVKLGAEVKAIDKNGCTALSKVCKSQGNKADVIGFLINCGVDVNARDANGNTPLICLCSGSGGFINLNAMQYLINAGASVNAANNKGETALTKLCSRTNIDNSAIELLLSRGANKIVNDSHSRNVLEAIDYVKNTNNVELNNRIKQLEQENANLRSKINN